MRSRQEEYGISEFSAGNNHSDAGLGLRELAQVYLRDVGLPCKLLGVLARQLEAHELVEAAKYMAWHIIEQLRVHDHRDFRTPEAPSLSQDLVNRVLNAQMVRLRIFHIEEVVALPDVEAERRCRLPLLQKLHELLEHDVDADIPDVLVLDQVCAEGCDCVLMPQRLLQVKEVKVFLHVPRIVVEEPASQQGSRPSLDFVGHCVV